MNTDVVISKCRRLQGRVPHPRLLLTEREKAPVVQARQPQPHLILSVLHSSNSVNDTCQGSRLVHKPIFCAQCSILVGENSQFLARETHITAVKCQYKLWDAVVNSPN